MTIMMRREERSALDAVKLTIAEDRGRLVATFFTAEGDETGYTPHVMERSQTEVIAHYETRGWQLVSHAWAVWSLTAPERLLELVQYEQPISESEARAGLREPVVPLTGRLEAIDEARLHELRETFEGRVRRG